MKTIHAFDFDGTLTTRDTLLAFIGYVHGTRALLWGLLRHAPLLVRMKLGLYPNGLAKERVFAWFFRGMETEAFDAYCRSFAASHRHLLRPEAIKAVEQTAVMKDEAVIVTASVENWVQPFFPAVSVLGTRIEMADGRLTGRFATPNCYGQEKVNRLLALYPDREDYYLIAYGDSRGDRELLAFADEAHYRPFRTS